MTKTLTLAIVATLSLTACAKHDDGTNSADTATVNETLSADENGLSNSDTLNAGDASLEEGNGADLNIAAPASNAQ